MWQSQSSSVYVIRLNRVFNLQPRCGMRRYFESLRPADISAIHSVPDGIFLVRVDRAQYRWHSL